jgi:DNA-binding MarR family transcriptional regulator
MNAILVIHRIFVHTEKPSQKRGIAFSLTASSMTDALVLKCIVSHNRPFNTQLVADLLATKGVKKPAAQRSLDSLAAAGKIRVKVRI